MIDRIILEDLEEIKTNLEKDFFFGKRVLVTGGAGFIGSWICDVLISLNAEVDCLDNFSTGKINHLNHLTGKAGFRIIREDVCNFKNDIKYDLILHLASRASPEEYQQHPIKTLQANSFGSYNMLELARKNDAGLLFTSTSEVYGNAKVVPTPETYWGNVSSVGLRSCYDEGKRFGEALCMAYYRSYGLKVKIARIFNSYGPRLRSDGSYGRVVSRFIMQTLENRPITIYGNGKQTRSFCYISDTVNGLMLLTTSEKVSGKVVNIGNSEEITILKLAQEIKELTCSQSTMVFSSLPEDDPPRRCPDLSLATKFLGWKPEIDLKHGLMKTISWFHGS